MMRYLCVVADVQRVLDTAGRFTDEEILAEISSQTDDIYNECGDPISATITPITKKGSGDEFYYEYFLGEKRISQIERVFVGTTTKRELIETTDFDVAKNVGMLKLTSSTVGGSRVTSNDELVIYYIPNLFAKYCAIRTAEALLENMDVVQAGAASRDLEIIRNKKEKQEKLINQRLGIVFSSANNLYDPVYGINLKKILQNHDMNLYLYRENSISD